MKNFIKKANQLFLRGLYSEAVAFYEKAIATDARLADVLAGNISIAKKRGGKKILNDKSILFISHDASMTGAPAVLLEIIKWAFKNTDYKIKIIVGGDVDDRLSDFSKYGDVLWLKGGALDEIKNFVSPEIELIYANTVVSAKYLEAVKQLCPGTRVIAHIHEREGVLNHFQAYAQYMIETVDCFILVDDQILYSLRRMGLKRNVAVNVIAPFIKENPLINPNDGDLVTIYGCGTIEDRKGFDLFCETISKLMENDKYDFKVAWIGGSSNDIEPDKSLARFDLKQKINMIGKVDDPSGFYKLNDIFFMSSREDPFPLVCMEAAQKGLALLSFDETAGSTANFIRSAECGLVCRYLDTDDAAHCLGLMLENSDMRRNMSNNARAYVQAYHTSEVKLPEIFSVINNPLADINLSNKNINLLVISFGPLPLASDSIVEGGGLRCWGLAKGFAQLQGLISKIAIAYPSWYDGESGCFDGMEIYKWSNTDELRLIVSDYSHVIVSYCYGSYSEEIKDCMRPDQTLILDCYVPIHTEVSARCSSNVIAEYNSFLNDKKNWEGVLKSGDYILCASPQQKNYYIGLLYGIGALHPINYNSSDNIIIAPFGVYGESYQAESTPISDYFIDKSSINLLWFGGVYPWFDIKILIDAVRELRLSHNITLTIVGAKNPFNSHPDFVKVSTEIVALSNLDEYKEFLYVADWVPYKKRFSWFNDASYIVTINKTGIENLFSWRTRLLDYIEFSTPFLTNGGDPLSEELIQSGLGRRINCEDVMSMKDSIELIVNSESSFNPKSKSCKDIKDKYKWVNICKDIYSIISI